MLSECLSMCLCYCTTSSSVAFMHLQHNYISFLLNKTFELQLWWASLDSVFPFSLLHLSMSTHDSKAKRSARGKAKHTPVFNSTRFHNCSSVDATVVSGHTLDHSCAGWMITSPLRPLLNCRLHWDQTERPVFVTHALYLTFTEHLLSSIYWAPTSSLSVSLS